MCHKSSLSATRRWCSTALQVFHYLIPLAVWLGTVGVPLPNPPVQCSGVTQEFHCQLL